MPATTGQRRQSLLQRTALIVLCEVIIMATFGNGYAASKDLGNGFRDLGVAVPISNHRGSVATIDGQGRNVLLQWLMDHRGGYELLMIDAQTGKTDEFPIPFPNEMGDSPYTSLLSSANRFYTHFANYFVEFDPVKRAYTFHSKTAPQMGMGMTEDDNGTVWSVSYPQSGVVSYNPKTGKFRDYGHVYEQNWPQYQRFMAADDQGWIYFALGQTASQIVALDPASGRATPILPENEREKGTAYVYRDVDGKVYGQAHQDDEHPWYELYKGAGKKIGKHTSIRPKKIITGNQAMFQGTFPDGSRVTTCSLVDRKLFVEDARTSKIREMDFDYNSEGAEVMGVAAAPNGTASGGTAFPMRWFSYDPKTDKMSNQYAYGQWNTVARQADRFFVGGYPGGFLLEWNPAKPIVQTDPNDPKSNPEFLAKVSPAIHRPHCLLPLPDGKLVIMGGTPEYGYTGGGLLIWDREKHAPTVLQETDLIPNQSTMSVVPLPGGKLLAGSTTAPGTGGEKKANEAEMYILDLATKKMDWHAVVLPGVQEYTTLYVAPGGSIYGFADRKTFFVFDPAKRSITYKKDMSEEFGPTSYQQGPRIFVTGPENKVYVLFTKGIATVDPNGYKFSLIAKSPIELESGGDYLDGRIYFKSGSHIYSYQIQPAAAKAEAK